MNRVLLGIRVRNWLLVAVCMGLAGWLAVQTGARTSAAQGGAERATDAHSSGGVDYARSLSKAFREAAHRVLPSVVLIKNVPAVAKQSNLRQSAPDDDDDNDPFERSPFGDIFPGHPDLRRFFGEIPRMPGDPHGGVYGLGSGVIIDASGIILTNNHVVDGDGKITVQLADGRELPAVDVKRDPKSDLAIVRIKSDESLRAARLGDSDKMDVGDWVLALGDMFDLEGTVTAGIISSKGRSLGRETRADFLQTDAAINPGSSGGPLINLDGEVIGINTAIHTQSGGNQGVGFAIPSNLAKWVSDQLVKTGSVKRAYLGVAIRPLDQQLADQFGVRARQGVLVEEVMSGSPAAAAGLKEGDVILKFADRPVNDSQQLVGLVDRSPIGGTVTLDVVRDGKRRQIPVTLREQAADYGTYASRGPDRRGGRGEHAKVGRLGIQVDALTNDVAEHLGLKPGSGVVITEVAPGSVADRSGLEAGMVIAEVNRKPIKSIEDFTRALALQPPSKGLLLRVRTADGARYVAIPAEE